MVQPWLEAHQSVVGCRHSRRRRGWLGPGDRRLTRLSPVRTCTTREGQRERGTLDRPVYLPLSRPEWHL